MDIDPQTATTFPQFVRAAAKVYNDKTAITLVEDGKILESLTFADLERRSAEVAQGLLARGVSKGTRVGFIIGNNPSFAIALAAIARIGAIAIPLSTLIKSDELIRTLRQSDVSILIIQRRLLGIDLVERLCDALPGLRAASHRALYSETVPYLRHIVSTGDDLPASIHGMDWVTGSAKAVSEELLVEIESEVHTEDQMIEIYTSGSMALPKGVKHNHGPVMFRTHYVRAMNKLSADAELTASLPMFWIGGLGIFLLSTWEVGATLHCTERTTVNSQAAMGAVLADDDLKNLPAAATYWALGMSETVGPYSWGDVIRVPGRPLCAPIDHIADRFEVRLVDDQERDVGDGEVGEVQVRGYALTPGLHKIEREKFFTADGYYRTGDLGLREGSRIHFVGRNGDMIKTAGSNVSPAEVEMEIQKEDGVHSAFVVGVPDDQRGQRVVAAIVSRAGAVANFADIETNLRSRLSAYKVPRFFFELQRDEIPMLHSNKVARRKIEELAIERLNSAKG